MSLKYNIDLTPIKENQYLLEPTYKAKILLNNLVRKLELAEIPLPKTIVVDDFILLEFINQQDMKVILITIKPDERIEYCIGNIVPDTAYFDPLYHVEALLNDPIPSTILEELKQYKINLELQ